MSREKWLRIRSPAGFDASDEFAKLLSDGSLSMSVGVSTSVCGWEKDTLSKEIPSGPSGIREGQAGSESASRSTTSKTRDTDDKAICIEIAILDNMRQIPVSVVKYVENARKIPMVM